MATKKSQKKFTSTKKIPESTVVSSEAMTQEMTTDTKVIIVVLLLIFVYPVGVICMWIMMTSWPLWVKIILSVPFLVAIIMIAMLFRLFFYTSNLRHEDMQPDYRMQNTMQPTTAPFSITSTPAQGY